MPQTTLSPPGGSEPKRGTLTGGALTDEVFDSSPTLLRSARGGDAVAGLQQFFTPLEAAELVAEINGRALSTLDLTAGDGALLAGVRPEFRFGIEIDADHLAAETYRPIHSDVQRAYPLLRLLGTRFPRVSCNPPFGLNWSPNGQRENSTVATWRMAMGLLSPDGCGAFIAGRDRFSREVASRPDAAGIYATVECDDLFEGVALPCLIAFFVAPENVAAPRAGGAVGLSARRGELEDLTDDIRAERARVAGYVAEPYLCRHRETLTKHFGSFWHFRGSKSA
jgi:hypothetical protein